MTCGRSWSRDITASHLQDVRRRRAIGRRATPLLAFRPPAVLQTSDGSPTSRSHAGDYAMLPQSSPGRRCRNSHAAPVPPPSGSSPPSSRLRPCQTFVLRLRCHRGQPLQFINARAKHPASQRRPQFLTRAIKRRRPITKSIGQCTHRVLPDHRPREPRRCLIGCRVVSLAELLKHNDELAIAKRILWYPLSVR
jgi:hypothetical protein